MSKTKPNSTHTGLANFGLNPTQPNPTQPMGGLDGPNPLPTLVNGKLDKTRGGMRLAKTDFVTQETFKL